MSEREKQIANALIEAANALSHHGSVFHDLGREELAERFGQWRDLIYLQLRMLQWPSEQLEARLS